LFRKLVNAAGLVVDPAIFEILVFHVLGNMELEARGCTAVGAAAALGLDFFSTGGAAQWATPFFISASAYIGTKLG
jgi:hypothetical protein